MKDTSKKTPITPTTHAYPDTADAFMFETPTPQEHTSIDPRIRHAGKGGTHHTRELDLRRGSSRKMKHRHEREW